MTLKRTVDVPKMEAVEFVRVGRIDRVTPEAGRLTLELTMDVRHEGDRRGYASEDPAGDVMRPGPFLARWTALGAVYAFDASPAIVPGDWLWVENAGSMQESLRDAMRRQLGSLVPDHIVGGYIPRRG